LYENVSTQHANKATHQQGFGKGSTSRDSTWTEQIEQSQQQPGNKKQISDVAKAPQDDQHDVYTTGTGPVVGSGSAASSTKRLLIRTPDNSPLKSKKVRDDCSAAELDDFYWMVRCEMGVCAVD